MIRPCSRRYAHADAQDVEPVGLIPPIRPGRVRWLSYLDVQFNIGAF